MDQATWASMPEEERAKARDLSGLTPQLIGWEGWRVEVETGWGERRRFIVDRSTGWRPCHITRARRDSVAGMAAEMCYKSVRGLYKVHS